MTEFNTVFEDCFFILCEGVKTVKNGFIKKEIIQLVFTNLPGLFI
jgi:hypothetical protein